ncbi:MAG: hypothetical protein GYA48_11685 [Chloroflexi bacterium]|nr:hypothetical protein [Chloroflexota bacterium]
MKKMLFTLVLVALMAVLLVGCAAPAAPAEVAQEEPAPAATAVPTEAPTEPAPTEAPAEEPTAEPAPAEAALKITGMVGQEMAWSEDEVKALEVIEVESTNKDGETSTYEGVLISKLLEMAAPSADATTLVFVADDGYTAEAAIADVSSCADCIVSFRSKGGFSTVLPGFEGKLQVKGVVEIQVK